MVTANAEQSAADPIEALIGDAFDATRDQPTPERLAEIDKLLREEIDRLSTIARRMADRKPHRSRNWYALVNATDRADDALQFQRTEGFSGALNVAELARRVRELRQVVGQ